MTPTEVLKELRKMPLEARRLVHDELHDELLEQSDTDERPNPLIRSMMEKGNITELPRKERDSIERRNFKRISVSGEPVSETIIKERR